MSIKFSDIVTYFQIPPLGINPGTFIQRKFNNINIHKKRQFASNHADTIYKNFLKTLPSMKEKICTLAAKHHITPVHLPLLTHSIFLNFVDELIEHYQNQLEHKDEEMNKQWLDLKSKLVKMVDQPWTNNSEQINALLTQIKTKLECEGASSPDFDEMVFLWKEILNVQFTGNVTLAAIFEKSAYSNRIEKNDDNTVQDIIIPFSTGDLIQSYFLFLRQIQRNFPWMLSEILEKTSLVADQNLATLLKEFCIVPPSLSSKSIPELAQLYVEAIQPVISSLSSLDI